MTLLYNCFVMAINELLLLLSLLSIFDIEPLNQDRDLD